MEIIEQQQPPQQPQSQPTQHLSNEQAPPPWMQQYPTSRNPYGDDLPDQFQVLAHNAICMAKPKMRVPE